MADNQQGSINTLLIPLILSVVLLVGALSFAVWAYMGRQDYKNNVDQKIIAAVEVAKKETATEKDNQFAEQEKKPLKNYQGPSEYGGIVIKYPKTWSGYVDQSSRGSSPVDGYFYPNTVPGTQSGAAYALRVQVTQRSFSDEVKAFDVSVKSGNVKSKSYTPANVKNVVGLRVEGEISPQQRGIMVLLPLRDKTIKIYTQSDQFFNDFDKNILPNFSFTP